MSDRLPRRHRADAQNEPTSIPAEPLSISIAHYRTAHELAFYLRAFEHLGDTRWVLVVGLSRQMHLHPQDIPDNVRLILTTEDESEPLREDVGWHVPDPQRAVLMGLAGHRGDEALMLLFPTEWKGPSPDELIEKAQQALTENPRPNRTFPVLFDHMN